MAASALTPNEICRFSVAQYHAMIKAGILDEDEPIELLEGWLVNKMPKNPKHSVITQLLRDLLATGIPSGWLVNVQEPITLSDSEPEPDVVIVRGERRQYLHRHPEPQDITLVVEVADSSLQRDRTTKKKLYAEAGIPEYWIINLVDNQLERFTEPRLSKDLADYRRASIYKRDESIDLWLEEKHLPIKIADLLL